jgi:hypothetical protein
MAGGPKLPFQKYKAVNKPSPRPHPSSMGSLTAEADGAGRSQASAMCRPSAISPATEFHFRSAGPLLLVLAVTLTGCWLLRREHCLILLGMCLAAAGAASNALMCATACAPDYVPVPEWTSAHLPLPGAGSAALMNAPDICVYAGCCLLLAGLVATAVQRGTSD